MNRTVPLDPEIRVVSEYREAVCQVSLSGRITIDSSPGLHALLLERIECPRCQILMVNFCEVAYIDTSGLAVLVEILKAARLQEKVFHLIGLRERPRYLLEKTRLLHLFDSATPENPQSSAS